MARPPLTRMELAQMSNEHGAAVAASYFSGRMGHGGQVPARKVLLTEAKLAAFVALAYQRGFEAAEAKR